jgi:MoaA/NifB/PqqE/SkfB family radical SAM enzyme
MKQYLQGICDIFLYPFIDSLILKYFKTTVQPFNKPQSINLFVTNACNLKCRMCDIWKVPRRNNPEDLRFETAKRIIDTLTDWIGSFHLSFGGGEPFLNSDLLKTIAYANKKGITMSVNTNGYIIDENLARKIIDSNIDSIHVSIDGSESEHDFIRGHKGSFKKALQAVENLNKYKKNNNKVFMDSVISRNNILIIDKIVELAIKLDVDGVSLQALMPNFAGNYKPLWYNDNPFWPKNTKQIQSAFTGLYQYKKRLNSFILNSMDNLREIEKYYLDPGGYQEKIRCYVGFNSMIITADGDMLLCHFMNKVGNILRDDPEKMWKSFPVKRIRKSILHCKRPCKLLPCTFIRFHF